MVITIFGYYSIKRVFIVNKEPNSNILEMSIRKSLIEIANVNYEDTYFKEQLNRYNN